MWSIKWENKLRKDHKRKKFMVKKVRKKLFWFSRVHTGAKIVIIEWTCAKYLYKGIPILCCKRNTAAIKIGNWIHRLERIYNTFNVAIFSVIFFNFTTEHASIRMKKFIQIWTMCKFLNIHFLLYEMCVEKWY